MATEPNIHAVHDHEHTDMNIAAIVWFGVGLTVSAIIIYFALDGCTGISTRIMLTGNLSRPIRPCANCLPILDYK